MTFRRPELLVPILAAAFAVGGFAADGAGGGKGGVASLRSAEGGTLPQAGYDGIVAAEPVGGSPGRFMDDRAKDTEARSGWDAAFQGQITGERAQAAKNDQAEREAAFTREQGAEAAAATLRQSAGSVAAAQDKNSWGTAVAEGVQQGVSVGVTSFGQSFGAPIGDKVGQHVAKGVFGKKGVPKVHAVDSATTAQTSVEGQASVDGGTVLQAGAGYTTVDQSGATPDASGSTSSGY